MPLEESQAPRRAFWCSQSDISQSAASVHVMLGKAAGALEPSRQVSPWKVAQVVLNDNPGIIEGTVQHWYENARHGHRTATERHSSNSRATPLVEWANAGAATPPAPVLYIG